MIAKTQAIKSGLIHDLFTRGVTSDGKLRPPREEAPQLYKESPIGWIPKEWRLTACASVTDLITVGIVVRPTQYYVAEGVPALRSANVREDGIDASDMVYISAIANAQLIKSQLQTGDVISVRTGYPGTTAVVTEQYAGCNCIDILISRPTPELRSAFLAFWINSPFGKEQILRKQGGLAQQHFNVGELRALKVAIPDIGEQDRIVEPLESVNSKLADESLNTTKLRVIQQGLMQDLLMGRVPLSGTAAA